MLVEIIHKYLKSGQFISVATADGDSQPNSAPKLVYKVENNFIYLVDYILGRTSKNLRKNPRISLSVMDTDNLEGYRLNGQVELIEKGKFYDGMVGEFKHKMISLSANRVIEGLQTGKKHEHFELEIPDKFIFYKIEILEAVKIGRQGQLLGETRENAANR